MARFYEVARWCEGVDYYAMAPSCLSQHSGLTCTSCRHCCRTAVVRSASLSWQLWCLLGIIRVQDRFDDCVLVGIPNIRAVLVHHKRLTGGRGSGLLGPGCHGANNGDDQAGKQKLVVTLALANHCLSSLEKQRFTLHLRASGDSLVFDEQSLRLPQRIVRSPFRMVLSLSGG